MELKKIKLKKLLADLPVKIIGSKDLEITGLSTHSKTVAPGHLFLAKQGHTSHGSKYIEEAIIGGARAIVTDLYDPFCKDVVQIITEDPRAIEGELTTRFYNHPTKSLCMIGITGTNGKTTTAYLVRAILGEESSGLIGTIEYLLGKTSLPASYTTPDVVTNFKMLAKMRDHQIKNCVMEVTSHGLVQNRVASIDFDYAIFTNITQDHLDYHKTFENYVQAKAKLFEGLTEDKTAILNADSDQMDAMKKNCQAKIVTFGISKPADYQAKDVKLHPHGTEFTLSLGDKTLPIKTNLVGQFNVYNTLAAIAVAHQKGMDLKTIQSKVKTFIAPKGRLEPVQNDRGLQIYVDFAHTEDALKNVLLTLKQIQHKKLITVFGCGGDRDLEKRPLMGRVVSELSDLTIVTSDNPRTEDPQKICQEILKGCSRKNEVLVEVDREEAMQKALSLAESGDILLVAGRGHETQQIIGHKRIDFNDKEVLERLLKN